MADRLPARLLEDGPIAQQIGHAELGQARLARAEELAGAAQLEVDLGDPKAVAGGHHGVEAPPGVVPETRGDEKDAVRLPGAAAHATAQLMELGEAEAVGVLDEHDGGVGDVDADLDDGRGDQDDGSPRP